MAKKRNKPKHGIFFCFLVGMALLTIFTLLAHKGYSIINISQVKVGEELNLQARDIDGLNYVKANVLKEFNIGQIEIKADDNILYKGRAFSKFRITSTHNDSLGNLVFHFKFRKKMLNERDFDINKIVFYANGEKKELIFVRDDTDEIFYTSTSDRIGEFVIAEKIEKEIMPPQLTPPIEKQPRINVPTPIVEQEPSSMKEKESLFKRIGNWFKNFLILS